ncbi:MAG: DF family (seleno)protein [Solirubrobacteraceae bacterium]
MSALTVELLYFEGCPNVEAARALVQDVAADEGITPDVRLVEVTPEDAERLRFLGSPSVRVNGHDVEPGADLRETFVFACRVYRTPTNFSGQPAREWVRAALMA